MRITSFCRIKSKAGKIDGGFHKLSACLHQSHFSKHQVLGPPYVLEYNGNYQLQNLECLLFYMLKYVKGDFMCS